MKYGITVNGRLTEVTSIPSPLPFGATPEEFLDIVMPGKTGWKEVPETSVNGTLDDGNGGYTDPVTPAVKANPTERAESDFKASKRAEALTALEGDESATATALRVLIEGEII